MAIDYEALAKQAGALSSEDPADKVDYSALAKQAGATSSEPPPEIQREKPSLGVRLSAGVNDVVQGARVVGHRIVGDSEGADRIVEQNKDDNALYEAGRGADSGIDFARLAGNIALTAPIGGIVGGAARAAGGGLRLVGAARAADLAGKAGTALESAGVAGKVGTRIATGATTGSIGGGLTGAGQGDGVEGSLIGAAAGGLLGALSPVISKAVSGAAKKIIGAFKSTPSRAQIEEKLAEALKEYDVDYFSLSQKARDSLSSKVEVEAAVKTGGTIDAQLAARVADFEELGIPSTKGQVTRDAQQYSFEKNAAKQPHGQPIADVYTAQNQGLQDSVKNLRISIAPESTKHAAGQKAIEALSNIDRERQKAIGKLYDAFREDGGKNLKVDGVRLANDTFKALEDNSATADLPPSLSNALNQFVAGKVEPTVLHLDALNHAISRATSGASPAQKFAIGVLKDNIDQAVNDAAESAGSNVSAKLAAARAAARARFKTHEDIPALRAAVQESVEPEDFVRKFVTNGKNSDLENLASTLKTHAPETFDAIRAQVIDDIMNNAVNGFGDTAKFSQAGFVKALKSIDPDKIKIIFTPKELETLNRIARVASYANNDPLNSSVNYSNSAIAFFNQAAPIVDAAAGKFPLIGRLAVKAFRDNAAIGRAQSAVKPVKIATEADIPAPFKKVVGSAAKIFGYNPAASGSASENLSAPERIELPTTTIYGDGGDK